MDTFKHNEYSSLDYVRAKDVSEEKLKKAVEKLNKAAFGESILFELLPIDSFYTWRRIVSNNIGSDIYQINVSKELPGDCSLYINDNRVREFYSLEHAVDYVIQRIYNL